jgi:hypothetical protein
MSAKKRPWNTIELFKGPSGAWAHYLQGKRVLDGDVLELDLADDVLIGVYRWPGRAAAEPLFVSKVAGRPFQLRLPKDARVRWPRSRSCRSAAS